MAKFIDMTVLDVTKTTADASIISLRPADGSTLPFIHGQYLTFRATIEGVELRRSYSICSAVGDPIIQVAVKQVNGGAFSNWVNTHLNAGDTISALAPMGHFHTALHPDARKSYLGFALGSGITPLLSIIKTTLLTEPKSQFTLIYANRSPQSIMFREELEDLKNQFMTRLNIVHILKTGQEDIDLFSGRLDRVKLEQLFTSWIQVPMYHTAFICGPEEAMKTIATALADFGMVSDQIKYELFGTAQKGRAKPQSTPQADNQVTFKIIADGASLTVTGDSNTSLLDAALKSGIDAPYACKAGVCSTCRCRVTSGHVQMRTNHALEDYEVKQGYVLSCQSYATSDTVVFDYET